MKKLSFLAAAAAIALGANAAEISYSTDGVLNYTEETEAGNVDFTFKKCMTNNLFTFFTIKLNGKVVNQTSSDNIGPFLAGGEWMGANHNTPQGGPTPSAYTRSVTVAVDGTPLEEGSSATGKIVDIEVKNDIYNLGTGNKFTEETVKYRVSGNSIEVWAEHHFTYPTAIQVSRYYGPQSMFPATGILLPGKSRTWYGVAGTEIDVYKSECPNFSTFIERSANGYQAVLKYNEGIGDGSMINSKDGRVYLWRRYGGATGKSYHVMIWDRNVTPDLVTNWHALYSWFAQPVNDTFGANVIKPEFSYQSSINGEPVVLTVTSDGKSAQTAGIEDVIADSDYPPFAFAGEGYITVTDDAPNAVCVDLAGKTIHTGAGKFACPQGIYIVNDMLGHSVKLIVK